MPRPKTRFTVGYQPLVYAQQVVKANSEMWVDFTYDWYGLAGVSVVFGESVDLRVELRTERGTDPNAGYRLYVIGALDEPVALGGTLFHRYNQVVIPPTPCRARMRNLQGTDQTINCIVTPLYDAPTFEAELLS